MPRTTQAQTQDSTEKDNEQTQGDPQEVLLIKGVYATEYYERNKIPYCSLCGEAYHNSPVDCSPICPEGLSTEICPRLKG